jgi:hypothetical protein
VLEEQRRTLSDMVDDTVFRALERDTKPTNPKDAIGSDKLPVHLVPSTATALESLAFLEGALKYGKYNWRIAGVRMSIYLDALERHLAKLKNGEWADPGTGVPHLASIRACAGIIIDADVCGKLVDDRPPRAPVAEFIDSLAVKVVNLKARFSDRSPHQYTIADSTPVEQTSDAARYFGNP